MTITSSTIKLKGKSPLVVLGLSEYEKLMGYIEDMEDRLAIRKRIHEENIPWEETQKKLTKKLKAK